MSLIQKALKNRNEIKKMLIISRAKCGKTSNLMQLPNSIIIENENSSGFFDGNDKVNVMERSVELKKDPIFVYKMIAKELRTLRDNGTQYDFIILDTLTRLEDHCFPYALFKYKSTPMGNGSEAKHIRDVAKGGGWGYLREAVQEIINLYSNLAKHTLILTGHVKDSAIYLDGDEISVTDIDLTGKLRTIIPSQCDANGIMRVHKDDIDKRILTFKHTHGDIITGARASHLANKEFTISTYDPTTELVTTYWDQIFPFIKEGVPVKTS